jgi:hypothetical protein
VATFAELLSDVYEITNRPDLIAETKLAVKQATLKLHQLDFFWKDLYETGIQFDTASFTQQIEYRTVISKFRAMKYLRKAESDGTAGVFLTPVDPAQVLDRYATTKDDVYYTAGAVIQIRSSTELQYMILGCYVHPDVTEAGYNSWIALDHPYAIVLEAAATVFKMIGYVDQEVSMRKLSEEQIQMIKISNIEGEGN